MKIAVLIDCFELHSWKYKIIEDLYKNKSVELKLIKIKHNPLNKMVNYIQKLNCVLFYIYVIMDYLIFSKTNKFKETKNAKDALQKINIKNLKITTIEIEHSYIPEEKMSFDLIIDLTRILKKDFYEKFNAISRKGICFFEFGEKTDLYQPFLNEIYLNKSLINLYLSITNGKQKKVIYKSCSFITNLSLYLNKNKNLWKASDFINRKIDEINNDSILDFNSNDKFSSHDIKIPSNFFMVKFMSKILSNFIKEKSINLKFKRQWFLAYQKVPKEADFISEDNLNFKIINPSNDKFFADPFIVNENNKSYVFFEEYCFLKQKGMISYLNIDEEGTVSEPQVILEKDYHLSYPFVFKHENKYYMIPETLGNETIELYEATNFPKKWNLKKVLFNNINAVDNSLVFYNQKFWLFTNLSVSGAALSDELFVFYSDSLLGEWTPHSKNPVISNSKTSRSAGKFFFHEGKLIRPSQESSIRYGYALNFNNVEVLTENNYQETLIKTVKPEFIEDNLAIHTFNSDNIYNIIDGMKLVKK